MEVIFVLLLLIWIVTRFLGRRPAADGIGNPPSRRDRGSRTEPDGKRLHRTVRGTSSAPETDPSDPQSQTETRGEPPSSHPGDDTSAPSTESERRSPPRTAARSTSDRVRERLKSPRSRREIFLLKELIDPPRSQRPWPF